MRKNSIYHQLHNYLPPVLFVLLDYSAILLAEKAAFELHWLLGSMDYHIGGSYIYLWIPLVFLMFLGSSRAYTHMQPILENMKDIFYSVIYGLVTCLLVLYFFRESLVASRLYVVLFGILVLFNIYCLRYIARKFLKRFHLLTEPVILIGAGKTAKRVLRFYDGDLGYRYDIIGLLDDHPISPELTRRFLLLGNLDQAEEIIRQSGVKTVIITAPGLDKNKLTNLISRIQPYVRNVSYVPDLIGTPMGSVTVDTFFDERVLMLHLKNNLARRRNRLFKRIFDLSLTIVGGFCLLPILLVLTILVRMDSKGPAFYNAARIGKHGNNFKCYKFRSMYQDSDHILQEYLKKNPESQKEWDTYAKLRDYDPRVTKVGTWMRKYSLDELPQLWNVIKGDMSLVGPRPYLLREKGDIGKDLGTICQTVPGITGYWQVSGRNEITFSGRVAMDTWYVQNWSIWIDLMYLFKTFKVVFGGRGAY